MQIKTFEVSVTLNKIVINFSLSSQQTLTRTTVEHLFTTSIKQKIKQHITQNSYQNKHRVKSTSTTT